MKRRTKKTLLAILLFIVIMAGAWIYREISKENKLIDSIKQDSIDNDLLNQLTNWPSSEIFNYISNNLDASNKLISNKISNNTWWTWPKRKIITYKSKYSDSEDFRNQINTKLLKKWQDYKWLKATPNFDIAMLTDSEAKELQSNPLIEQIEDDAILTIKDPTYYQAAHLDNLKVKLSNEESNYIKRFDDNIKKAEDSIWNLTKQIEELKAIEAWISTFNQSWLTRINKKIIELQQLHKKITNLVQLAKAWYQDNLGKFRKFQDDMSNILWILKNVGLPAPVPSAETVKLTSDWNTDKISDNIPWWVKKLWVDKIWDKYTWKWIIIGIIDTWISISHEDLSANLLWSYNAIDPDKTWEDDNWHWTHLAWIIAAASNNKGIIWIAPDSKIIAIKSMDFTWHWYTSDVIVWIKYAVENWAQIINLSIWTDAETKALKDAIDEATNTWVLIIAASWNNSWWSVQYPAKLANVIAVSALNNNGSMATYSNYWKEIDFAAPWTSIISTYLNNQYAQMTWTSNATSHVVWLSALLLSSPVWTYDSNSNWKWDINEITKALKAWAVDWWTPWFDVKFGFWEISWASIK